MNPRTVSAVLYHYPCPDGAFAALAAHLYFKTTNKSDAVLFFPNTVYNPIATPSQLPLENLSHVYLLDFIGPPSFIPQLTPLVPNVVVLDHHKTAFETLSDYKHKNLSCVLDIDRSGATIAFDYFRSTLVSESFCVGEFDRVRRLFDYIEDADLWRCKLPKSKAFSSGIKDLNLEFDAISNPSLFDQLMSLDVESVIRRGTISLSEKQKLIDDTLDCSYQIGLGRGAFGHCLAVDADASVSELRTELGHQLATKSCNMKLRGIGAVVYEVPELENNEMLKVSLRSNDEEDTSSISKEFGGGGHRTASSFMISRTEFQQWKINESNLL